MPKKCNCIQISETDNELDLCYKDQKYARLLCKRYYKRPRGLGDVVERALKMFGIKKKGCGGCADRQEKLNKRFPMN